MKFDIWLEGVASQGDGQKACFLGTVNAVNFKKACRRALINNNYPIQHYNEQENTFWIQRFFDNEKEARKRNG